MALIVAAYVKSGQSSALQDLKAHRQQLAASIRTRADFDFAALLDQLEDDIREIDGGLDRLATPAEAPETGGVKPSDLP